MTESIFNKTCRVLLLFSKCVYNRILYAEWGVYFGLYGYNKTTKQILLYEKSQLNNFIFRESAMAIKSIMARMATMPFTTRFIILIISVKSTSLLTVEVKKQTNIATPLK